MYCFRDGGGDTWCRSEQVHRPHSQNLGREVQGTFFNKHGANHEVWIGLSYSVGSFYQCKHLVVYIHPTSRSPTTLLIYSRGFHPSHHQQFFSAACKLRTSRICSTNCFSPSTMDRPDLHHHDHEQHHFLHHSHHSCSDHQPVTHSYPSPPSEPPHASGQLPVYEPAHRPSSTIQLPHGQLVKIFPKADKTLSLAVRDGGVVVLALADSGDESQLWIKEDSYGMRVKDNYGFPAFALVNKAYGKVLKHPREEGQQVLLADYRLGMIGDDILWSQSQDFGEGFVTIRVASDTLLNMTASHGEKKLATVKSGTPIILDIWHKHGGQLWKIFPLYVLHSLLQGFNLYHLDGEYCSLLNSPD